MGGYSGIGPVPDPGAMLLLGDRHAGSGGVLQEADE